MPTLLARKRMKTRLNKKNKESASSKAPTVTKKEAVSVKKTASSSGSKLSKFGAAFKAARKAGKKVFTFNGKKYTTKLKEEVKKTPKTTRATATAPKTTKKSTKKAKPIAVTARTPAKKSAPNRVIKTQAKVSYSTPLTNQEKKLKAMGLLTKNKPRKTVTSNTSSVTVINTTATSKKKIVKPAKSSPKKVSKTPKSKSFLDSSNSKKVRSRKTRRGTRKIK